MISQAKAYATNHIVMTMGMDFHYRDAAKWYRNLDMLINYVNSLVSQNLKFTYDFFKLRFILIPQSVIHLSHSAMMKRMLLLLHQIAPLYAYIWYSSFSFTMLLNKSGFSSCSKLLVWKWISFILIQPVTCMVFIKVTWLGLLWIQISSHMPPSSTNIGPVTLQVVHL